MNKSFTKGKVVHKTISFDANKHVTYYNGQLTFQNIKDLTGITPVKIEYIKYLELDNTDPFVKWSTEELDNLFGYKITNIIYSKKNISDNEIEILDAYAITDDELHTFKYSPLIHAWYSIEEDENREKYGSDEDDEFGNDYPMAANGANITNFKKGDIVKMKNFKSPGVRTEFFYILEDVLPGNNIIVSPSNWENDSPIEWINYWRSNNLILENKSRLWSSSKPDHYISVALSVDPSELILFVGADDLERKFQLIGDALEKYNISARVKLGKNKISVELGHDYRNDRAVEKAIVKYSGLQGNGVDYDIMANTSDEGIKVRRIFGKKNISRALYANGGSISNELENFDLNELDPFETMQYNHFVNSLTKEEALQVLINNVEGDYSQLSPKLAKLAEKQIPSEEYADGGPIMDMQTLNSFHDWLRFESKDADIHEDVLMSLKYTSPVAENNYLQKIYPKYKDEFEVYMTENPNAYYANGGGIRKNGGSINKQETELTLENGTVFYIDELPKDIKNGTRERREYELVSKGVNLFFLKNIIGAKGSGVVADTSSLDVLATDLESIKQPTEADVRRAMILKIGYEGNLFYSLKAGGESASDNQYSSSVTVDMEGTNGEDTEKVVIKNYNSDFKKVLITGAEVREIKRIILKIKRTKLMREDEVQGLIDFLIKSERSGKVDMSDGGTEAYTKEFRERIIKMILDLGDEKLISHCINYRVNQAKKEIERIGDQDCIYIVDDKYMTLERCKEQTKKEKDGNFKRIELYSKLHADLIAEIHDSPKMAAANGRSVKLRPMMDVEVGYRFVSALAVIRKHTNSPQEFKDKVYALYKGEPNYLSKHFTYVKENVLKSLSTPTDPNFDLWLQIYEPLENLTNFGLIKTPKAMMEDYEENFANKKAADGKEIGKEWEVDYSVLERDRCNDTCHRSYTINVIADNEEDAGRKAEDKLGPFHASDYFEIQGVKEIKKLTNGGGLTASRGLKISTLREELKRYNSRIEELEAELKDPEISSNRLTEIEVQLLPDLEQGRYLNLSTLRNKIHKRFWNTGKVAQGDSPLLKSTGTEMPIHGKGYSNGGGVGDLLHHTFTYQHTPTENWEVEYEMDRDFPIISTITINGEKKDVDEDFDEDVMMKVSQEAYQDYIENLMTSGEYSREDFAADGKEVSNNFDFDILNNAENVVIIPNTMKAAEYFASKYMKNKYAVYRKEINIDYYSISDVLKEASDFGLNFDKSKLSFAANGKKVSSSNIRTIVFKHKNNPSLNVTVKAYPNMQITEIENPRNVRFPFVVGQVLNMGHQTWACNNSYLVNDKDVCPEKKVMGIKVSDIPHGHPLRHLYPGKFH